jgi:hypothetical protein
MRPIVQTLTRDFWKKGIIFLVIILSVPVAFQLFRYTFFHSEILSFGSPGNEHHFNVIELFSKTPEGLASTARNDFYVTMWMELLWIWGVVCITGEITKQSGYPSFLFTLPITTFQLVGIRLTKMSMAILSIILTHLCVAFLFHAAIGAWPPLVEPILLIAAGSVWVLAIRWSSSLTPLLIFFFSIFVQCPVFAWMIHRYSYSTYMMRIEHVKTAFPIWDPVNWKIIVILVTAIISACIVVGTGIARERHGDRYEWPWRRFFSKNKSSNLVRPLTVRPFASPAAAQFWLEWREYGWVFPIIALATCAWIATAYFFDIFGDKWSCENILTSFRNTAVILPIVCAPFMGVLFGLAFTTSSNRLEPFRATRPMSNQAMAYSIFRAGAASMVLTVSICFAIFLFFGAWMASGVLGSDAVRASGYYLHNPYRVFLFFTPLLVLSIAWILFGLTATLALTGRVLIVAIVIFGMVYFLVGTSLAPGPIRAFLVDLGSALLLFGTPLAAAITAEIASKRRLVGPIIGGTVKIANIGLCAWVSLYIPVMPNGWSPWKYLEMNPLHNIDALYAWALFLPWLSIISLAPLVTGPLAMAWNRHR